MYLFFGFSDKMIPPLPGSNGGEMELPQMGHILIGYVVDTGYHCCSGGIVNQFLALLPYFL